MKLGDTRRFFCKATLGWVLRKIEIARISLITETEYGWELTVWKKKGKPGTQTWEVATCISQVEWDDYLNWQEEAEENQYCVSKRESMLLCSGCHNKTTWTAWLKQ